MTLANAMLTGLAGSALGFVGNVHGSNMSISRQKKLMEHQAYLNYVYGKATAENSPTWNRQGLESAGYNPMLAVQNATSGVNSNFASQSTSQEPDYGASLGSMIGNATALQHAENETTATDSTVKLNDANARNAVSQAISNEIHNKYLDDREQKELGKIGAEISKLGAEGDYYTAQIDAIDKRLQLEQYLGELGIYTNAGNVRYQSDKAYNASTYSADKSLEGTKYGVDNNMIKAGVGATLGTLGLLYGPAKLKALRLLGKTKAVGF